MSRAAGSVAASCAVWGAIKVWVLLRLVFDTAALLYSVESGGADACITFFNPSMHRLFSFIVPMEIRIHSGN